MELKKNEENDEEIEVEVEYPFHQTTKIMSEVIMTQNGKIEIKDLTYETSEEFTDGCYIITITDITKSQPALAPIKIALVIS